MVVAMAVLIDPPRWPHRGHRWSHLVSDTAYEELHAFAARLGIGRQAFQGDHYDLPEHYYELAVELGAEPVHGRELVRRLRAAGLRRRRPGASARPVAVPAGHPQGAIGFTTGTRPAR